MQKQKKKKKKKKNTPTRAERERETEIRGGGSSKSMAQSVTEKKGSNRAGRGKQKAGQDWEGEAVRVGKGVIQFPIKGLP